MTSEEQFSAAEISWRWDGKDFISNRTRTGSIKLIFYWGGNTTETGCTRSWGSWLSQVGRAFPREISAKQESEAGGALALMI